MSEATFISVGVAHIPFYPSEKLAVLVIPLRQVVRRDEHFPTIVVLAMATLSVDKGLA